MAQRSCLIALLSCSVLLVACAGLRADDDYQAKEALWLTDHANLVKKLDTLIIGDVDIKNATIDQIFDVIRKKSEAAAPDHLGINIMAETNCLSMLRQHTYNVQLKRATVKDVIHQIQNPFMTYSVGDFVVQLRMLGDEEAYTRTYPVADNVLAINPSMLTDKDKLIYDVKPLFEAKGIKFPLGSSATYILPDKKLTVVTFDSETLIRIDELLIFGFK